MSVVWLILKVLLWILLIIVGLIVGLTILLFVLPIEYWVEGEKYEETRVHARLRIFYLLTVIFKLEDGKDTLEYRICGKKMGQDKKYPPKEAPKKEVQRKNADNKQTTKEEKVTPIKKEKKVNDNKEAVPVKGHLDTQVHPKSEPGPKKQNIEEPNKNEKEPTESKQKTSIKDIYYQVKDLWDDSERVGLVRAIKKLVISLVRTIIPRYFRFKVIIGRDDPADTGELLAKASLAYPWYGRYGVIQGDFEQAGLWGEVIIEGRLCIAQIIGPFIKFLLNHSVRHYIKIIWDIRKEEKNGI